MPMPINAPLKLPVIDAKNNPAEQSKPPSIVTNRQPILLTNALDIGAKNNGKLTNNDAMMPTVCNSSFKSSFIKCIKRPKENRTPSATKCTQNELNTIIHRQ